MKKKRALPLDKQTEFTRGLGPTKYWKWTINMHASSQKLPAYTLLRTTTVTRCCSRAAACHGSDGTVKDQLRWSIERWSSSERCIPAAWPAAQHVLQSSQDMKWFFLDEAETWSCTVNKNCSNRFVITTDFIKCLLGPFILADVWMRNFANRYNLNPFHSLFLCVVMQDKWCVLQVLHRLLQLSDQDCNITIKVVQQVGQHVAKQAPFVDDPLLQRMKFSTKWCTHVIRQFVSLPSGMPDSATRLRARPPVLYSMPLTEELSSCPANSSLFLKLSCGFEGSG